MTDEEYLLAINEARRGLAGPVPLPGDERERALRAYRDYVANGGQFSRHDIDSVVNSYNAARQPAQFEETPDPTMAGLIGSVKGIADAIPFVRSFVTSPVEAAPAPDTFGSGVGQMAGDMIGKIGELGLGGMAGTAAGGPGVGTVGGWFASGTAGRALEIDENKRIQAERESQRLRDEAAWFTPKGKEFEHASPESQARYTQAQQGLEWDKGDFIDAAGTGAIDAATMGIGSKLLPTGAKETVGAAVSKVLPQKLLGQLLSREAGQIPGNIARAGKELVKNEAPALSTDVLGGAAQTLLQATNEMNADLTTPEGRAQLGEFMNSPDFYKSMLMDAAISAGARGVEYGADHLRRNRAQRATEPEPEIEPNEIDKFIDSLGDPDEMDAPALPGEPSTQPPQPDIEVTDTRGDRANDEILDGEGLERELPPVESGRVDESPVPDSVPGRDVVPGDQEANAEVDGEVEGAEIVTDESGNVRGVRGKKGVYAHPGRTIEDEPHEVRYSVMDLDSIQPSNLPETGYQDNPNYPQLIQNRGYASNKAEQAKVERNAKGLSPSKIINENTSSDDAPPIVDSEGNVLAGNSRTMSLRVARQNYPDKYKSYRAYLRDNAAKYGLTSEDIDRIKNPVLVREVAFDSDTDYSQRKAFGSAANRSVSLRQTPSEMGATLATAGRIPDEVKRGLLDSIEGDQLGKALDDHRFVASFKKALYEDSPEEAAAYFSADGSRLNEQGKAIAKAMMYHDAIGDKDIATHIAGSDAKTRQGVENALVQLSGLKNAEASWRIDRPLRNALRMIAENPDATTAQDVIDGTSSDFLNDIGKEKPDPKKLTSKEKSLIRLLKDGKPTYLREALKDYAEYSKNAGGMFSDVEMTPSQALESIVNQKFKGADARSSMRETVTGENDLIGADIHGAGTVGSVRDSTPKRTLKSTVQEFQDSFKVDKEKAESYGKLIEARAKAKGMTADEWVNERIAGVKSGESVLGHGLFQSAMKQTDTDEFQRWFGKSKAVNESGEPIVLYHGTSTDFAEFDPAKAGGNTGAKNTTLGAFFSTDANVSSTFGDRVMPVYVRIEKPIEVGYFARQRDYSKTDRHVINEHKSRDGYDDLKDIIANWNGKKSWNDVTRDDVQAWKSHVQKMGYDGLIINTRVDGATIGNSGGMAGSVEPHKMYVAFDPTQVKSAIANSGTFDPNNPNILFQGAPLPNARLATPEQARAARIKFRDWWRKNPTANPYFKKWFKKSVVRNNDGSPKMMYHGTSAAGFNNFDIGKSGYGLFGEGAYFTESPAIASEYTDKGSGDRKGIYPVFLSVQNPIDMDAPANKAMWRKQFNGIDDYLESGHGERNSDYFTAAENMMIERNELGIFKAKEGSEWLRGKLEKAGFDGITHIGGSYIKKDGEKHRVYIAFKPEQIKSAIANDGMYRPDDPSILRQGAKGAVEFVEDGKAIIHALENPDASTGLHELAHVFRRDLEPELLSAAEKWAGVTDGKWERVHEEKFARGFERWLREGVAPTKELHNVFKQFKKWLTEIYKAVKGSDIDVKLSPEIRNVFAQMLGGEATAPAKVKTKAKGGDGSGVKATVSQAKPLAPMAPSATKGGDGGNVKSLLDISRDLSDAITDSIISYGRLKQKKAGGIFDPATGNVQVRKAGDLNAATHEVGHKLDDDYGLSKMPGLAKELDKLGDPNTPGSMSSWTKSKSIAYKRGEGIGEFIRYWLIDPDKAKRVAPNTHAAFEKILNESVALGDSLRAVQESIRQYRTAPAVARVKATIKDGVDIHKQMTKTSAKNKLDRFIANRLDDLHYLKLMAEDAGIAKGKKLRPSEDPYIRGRLTRGSSIVAEQFVERGVLDFKTRKVVGESLSKIFSDVGKDYKDFTAYIVARRSKELMRRGKLTPFDRASVEEAINTLKSDKFDDAFERLKTWQKGLVNYMVDSGLMTREAADKMWEMNMDYVPMHRVYETRAGEFPVEGGVGTKGLNAKNPINALTDGSLRDIVNPLESMLGNAMIMVQAADKNATMMAIVKALESKNMAKWGHEVSAPVKSHTAAVKELKGQLEELGADMEDVDMDAMLTMFSRGGPAPFGENTIRVNVNGKAKYYKLQPDIYEAITAVNRSSNTALGKWIHTLADINRAGITMTPEYVFRNLFRDAVASRVVSGSGGVFFGGVPGENILDLTTLMLSGSKFGDIGFIKNRAQKIRDSIEAFRASGGDFFSVTNYSDSKARQKFLQSKFKAELTAGERAKLLAMTPVSMYKSYADLVASSEVVGRAVEYRRIYKKAIKEGLPHEEATLLAAFEARDLQDFGMRGKEMYGFAAGVPFFNSGLQGMYKLGRAFKANKTATTIRALELITIPTVGLMALNWDNEEYWDRPQWQRDAFWLIPIPGADKMWPSFGGFFPIPKPFELGQLFGTLPERYMGAIGKGDPKLMEGMALEVASQFVPPVAPPVAISAVEYAANYNMFTGLPIVSEALQELPNELQYDENSTLTSRKIGEVLGVSPKKFDHMVKANTGKIGEGIMDWITDPILGAMTDEQGRKRKYVPGATAVTVSPAGANSEAVARFYRERDELTKQRNAAKKLGREFPEESNRRIKAMAKAASDMSDLREKIRETNDPKEQQRLRLEIREIARRFTPVPGGSNEKSE